MPIVVIQMVARFDVNAQRSAAGLILELELLSADDGQFDVIRGTLRTIFNGLVTSPLQQTSMTYLRMEKNGILDGCLEFKVNVPRVAHVEWWQIDGGVGDLECDNIVEQIITLAHQWSQCVASLLLVQRGSGVTESHRFHWQMFFLANLTAVLLPFDAVRVTIAPLCWIDATALDTALTFP